MKHKTKRFLSCLLALLLLLSALPAAVFADAEGLADETGGNNGQTDAVEELTGAAAPVSGVIPWETVYEASERPILALEKRQEQEEAPEKKPLLADFPAPIIPREEAVSIYRNVRAKHLEELSVAYVIAWDGKTNAEARSATLAELDKLREDACVHIPGEPKLGDSIAHNVNSFLRYASYKQTESGELAVYFRLSEIKYFTTLEQEAALDKKVEELLSRFQLDGKDDYQKVRIIYDWMVHNIRYSQKNENGAYDDLCFSAYSAAVRNDAVCEGIALLFYRLAMTVGVDTRYVTSSNHAWNIARLGDRYYYLDATWELDHADSWLYFLQGADTWGTHPAAREYNDDVFAASYPLSGTAFSSSVLTGPCGAMASYRFTVSEGTLSISGLGSMAELPSAASAPWAAYSSLVEHIAVGDGITGIGAHSFASCTELDTLRIPASVSEIGYHAVGAAKQIVYAACEGMFRNIRIDADDPYFSGEFSLALGEHIYIDEITAPRCTQGGSIVHRCACGNSYTENIPALGHRFSDDKCTRCGYVREAGDAPIFPESVIRSLSVVLRWFNSLNYFNLIHNIVRGVILK